MLSWLMNKLIQLYCPSQIKIVNLLEEEEEEVISSSLCEICHKEKPCYNYHIVM